MHIVNNMTGWMTEFQFSACTIFYSVLAMSQLMQSVAKFPSQQSKFNLRSGHGTSGGQSNIGVSSVQILQFSLKVLIPPAAQHSLIIL
jgi:hypothetical protein